MKRVHRAEKKRDERQVIIKPYNTKDGFIVHQLFFIYGNFVALV